MNAKTATKPSGHAIGGRFFVRSSRDPDNLIQYRIERGSLLDGGAYVSRVGVARAPELYLCKTGGVWRIQSGNGLRVVEVVGVLPEDFYRLGIDR